MKQIVRIRTDCLPLDIIRHLECQGLGWGHDLDSGCFRIKREAFHDNG